MRQGAVTDEDARAQYQARSEARRAERQRFAMRAGWPELNRSDLRFDPFGIVVDEPTQTEYRVFRGEVNEAIGPQAPVAAYYFDPAGGDHSPRAVEAVTYDCCIKVCRAYDTDALLGPVRGSGEMYERAGLMFLPSQTTVPVILDHDHARQVGEVFELATWEWTDQSGSSPGPGSTVRPHGQSLWSQERAVTHRGASEQLTGRGHEARASGPGWVAMARGGVGDRGVRRGCIVVGRFGQGATNDQRVDDTYTAAAPDFAKLRAAPPQRSTPEHSVRGHGVEDYGTEYRSCGPCPARADLSDRSVRGMNEISAGGPGPDKPRTASTTC